MLLRSSSTPIFASLLASSSPSSSYFSESPGHGGIPLERALSDTHNKLSFSSNQSNHINSSFHGCSLHLSSPSVDSRPPSGFRRVQSEGNLKNLDQRRPSPVLETIPSFSLHGSRAESGFGEEDDEFDESEETIEEDSSILFPGKVTSIGSPLFLAKGLGLEDFGGFGGTAGGGNGGVGGRSVQVDSNGSQADVEAYYKKMVEEDPGNALLLRNYAQFLHQTKRDLKKAEEYYSRALLAEPGDGEVLSKYAKVIWELHRDRPRAVGYFEQAVRAAPHNSHVLASYASFLWEADDDEEEDELDLCAGPQVPVMAHPGSLGRW